MNKKVVLIVLAIVIGVVGFLFLTEPENSEVSGETSNHTIGEGTAGVTLVEYGDFQCTACASYYTVLKQVKEKYGDQITFQYINLPIPEIHVNALASAKAAEAASLQGKFWEMHDKLFETQSSWAETGNPLSTFEGFARDIGIENMQKFTDDYKSTAVNDTINADIAKFNQTGRSKSTPTFFLNDSHIEPSPSLESFSELIDAVIAENSQVNEQADTEDTDAKPEE